MKLSYFFLVVVTTLHAELQLDTTLWQSLAPIPTPKEKKLAIIVTAYNAKPWYELNLGSIFAQRYKNYRLIYIDDCSKDGTSELVEEYVKKLHQEHRVTLIKNTEWKSQMANHYTAAHMCDDDEIMLNVDCDDWLDNVHVFELINKIYTVYPHVWVTYGGFRFYPDKPHTMTEIPQQVLALQKLRDIHEDITTIGKWNWWHPRTFYAWLFKQVKLQDVLFEGNFKNISASPDSAFMYPMMEMAGIRAFYVPDTLYNWNMLNPLSQWCSNAQNQLQVNRTIVNWQRYPLVLEPQESPAKRYSNNQADMLILSSDPKKLEYTLVNTVLRWKGLKKITVIYEASDNTTHAHYQKLAQRIAHVYFIRNQNKLKEHIQAVLSSAQEHIVITNHETRQDSRAVNLIHSIQELERTFAYGVYLGIERTADLPVVDLNARIGAWQFKYAKDEGTRMFSLNWVLYRKRTLLELFESSNHATIEELTRQWENYNKNSALIDRNVGLIWL